MATLEDILAEVRARDPDQSDFLQAVEEVAHSLKPVFEKHPEHLRVFRAMCEPERIFQFRVTWEDDKGQMHVNRAWRVQFNQAIGPYKGGLRLRGGLQLSTIKFLGFEQVFKNALTTLPMGGGKGGSDFDPKGKSDAEVRRFCEAFMTQLYTHIGANVDVPAGDIGVGAREIGFLYGHYKRLVHQHVGILTGKGPSFGGSLIRPEATGYGVVYFAQRALKEQGLSFEGKRVLVSGSGNVAQFASEKLIELGAKVVTLSDSSGCVYEENGLTSDQLKWIMDLKNNKRGRLSEYPSFSSTAKYVAGGKPWVYKADVALPCATQNEIDKADAESLAANGVKMVGEGANMPTTNEGVSVYKAKGIVYLPAKAANAGGVAVSGLEMSQNWQGLSWSREEVDAKLQSIMMSIYDTCATTAESLGAPGDLQLGANAGGFLKVATAMTQEGYVF